MRKLEEQVLKPIDDPNEMDLPVDEAARRVGLAPVDLSRALASFVRSLLSGDAPYDRFVNGDRGALSPEQQLLIVFPFWERRTASPSVPSPKFGDEFSGARRPAGKARRPSISGIFEGGATPPAGMPRPENVGEFRTRDTS